MYVLYVCSAEKQHFHALYVAQLCTLCSLNATRPGKEPQSINFISHISQGSILEINKSYSNKESRAFASFLHVNNHPLTAGKNICQKTKDESIFPVTICLKERIFLAFRKSQSYLGVNLCVQIFHHYAQNAFRSLMKLSYYFS